MTEKELIPHFLVDREHFYSSVGSEEAVTYQPVLRNGIQVFEVSDKINLPEYINSFKESCDLKTMIDRYMRTGDVSIIMQRNAQYFDALDLPDTLAKMYEEVRNAEHIFDSYPPEVRAKFNFSFDTFISQYKETPEFFEAIGLIKPEAAQAVPKIKEVADDEER